MIVFFIKGKHYVPNQKDATEIILSFFFKTGLSRLISKLLFIGNLNLLESDAKISKSSKVLGESHCNRCSDITGSLVFLIRFPVRFEVLCVLVKNAGQFFRNK